MFIFDGYNYSRFLLSVGRLKQSLCVNRVKGVCLHFWKTATGLEGRRVT